MYKNSPLLSYSRLVCARRGPAPIALKNARAKSVGGSFSTITPTLRIRDAHYRRRIVALTSRPPDVYAYRFAQANIVERCYCRRREECNNNKAESASRGGLRNRQVPIARRTPFPPPPPPLAPACQERSIRRKSNITFPRRCVLIKVSPPPSLSSAPTPSPTHSLILIST